jgi:oxygen-dependent protoporphyrinogen oxidase
MNAPAPRVAVIGGGISGLSAAHRIHELAPHAAITLFEASARLGGVLQTQRRDGYLIERSADMFITRDPWALELCRRIGFSDQLINTNSQYRKAFVAHRGRLVEVPEGFTLMSPARVWPVVRTPLLSWGGKMRLAAEYFVPRRKDERDESLREFSVRRFGREAYERLIQPLIGGIYTADPTKLSMDATMRQFVEMERKYGSLIRGMRAAARGPTPGTPSHSGGHAATPTGSAHSGSQPQLDGSRKSGAAASGAAASGARYGLFVAPRDGMTSMIEAIAARLPAGALRVHAPVSAIQRVSEREWMVTSGRPEEPARTEPFDAVIVACPAPRAATLINPWAPELGREVGAIPVAGAAIVVAAYRRQDVAHPLDGFGFVVPLVERLRILSGSFGSVKFDGRAPDDMVLTRVFLGGACQPELLALDDRDLKTTAHEELGKLLGIRAAPAFAEVVRWEGTMPQYHVGHLDRVAKIEKLTAEIPRFALAGNAYRGVGIPFCVRSGERAATEVVAQLDSAQV